MKKYKLIIPPEILSSIKHLHPLIKQKLQKALETIQNNPFSGKALRLSLEGLYSYRVSYLRIVYEINIQNSRLEVVDIAERKVVYQKLEAKGKH